MSTLGCIAASTATQPEEHPRIGQATPNGPSNALPEGELERLVREAIAIADDENRWFHTFGAILASDPFRKKRYGTLHDEFSKWGGDFISSRVAVLRAHTEGDQAPEIKLRAVQQWKQELPRIQSERRRLTREICDKVLGCNVPSILDEIAPPSDKAAK
jgi:hypothetical protein